jgi:hypothetical protein
MPRRVATQGINRADRIFADEQTGPNMEPTKNLEPTQSHMGRTSSAPNGAVLAQCLKTHARRRMDLCRDFRMEEEGRTHPRRSERPIETVAGTCIYNNIYSPFIDYFNKLNRLALFASCTNKGRTMDAPYQFQQTVQCRLSHVPFRSRSTIV